MSHEAVALMVHGITLKVGLHNVVSVKNPDLILNDICIIIETGASGS